MDLSKLSDSELKALYDQSRQPAADVSKMSDDELKAAYSATKPLKRVYITGEPPTGEAPPQTGFQQAVETGKGYLRAADTGIASGVAGLVGAPRTLTDLGAAGIKAASDLASDFIGTKRYEPPATPGPAAKWLNENLPRAEDIEQSYAKYQGRDKPYEPQGDVERAIKTVGEFSVGGGAGAASRAGAVARTVVPALASEVAGRASEGEWYEPGARLAGALLGAGGLAVAQRMNPRQINTVLREHLPPDVTPQHVAAAERLMQDAERAGGPRLSWPEALSQVAGRPVLTDMLRHIEASPQSAPRMNEFFADRPQRVEGAVRQQAAEISPVTNYDPSGIGPEVGRTADTYLRDFKAAINDATRPLYQRSAGELLTPHEFYAIRAVPGFEAAANAVRANPQLNRHVAQLPMNSVGFLNQVKIQLHEMADNAASPVTQGRSATVASGLSSDEAAVRQAAIRASNRQSGTYEQALNFQEQARRDYLQPLLDGPLGKLAAKDQTTKSAIDVLFPSGPEANSQREIANAVAVLHSRSPRATQDVVRAYVEKTFNQSAKDLQTGPNQAGGAKFRRDLVGDPQQRANLQAAIEALPNGQERWRGFDRMLDVLEATGTRQGIGSKTAYNQALEKGMDARGAFAAITKGPLGGLDRFAGVIDRWRYGQNLNSLADVLTDPRSGQMLRDIAAAPPASQRAHSLMVRLMTFANASEFARERKDKDQSQ